MVGNALERSFSEAKVKNSSLFTNESLKSGILRTVNS